MYGVSTNGSSGLSFTKTATLSGHGQFVSGLDWSTRGDQLLSCSHDRNAFVWTRAAASPAASRAASGAAASTSGGGGGGSGAWEKQMVITRLTKGALCVKWSPSEAKFAIGSAARNVCVGYYDPESKWWACKLIRKAHESSVVSVSWHPNSVLLATGATDRRVRLFNAYVRGYEPDAPAGALPEGSSFGDCLFEVAHDGCGWVHSVTFAAAAAGTASPGTSGAFPQLLYASHDFTVGVVDAAGGAPAAAAAVRLPDAVLPLNCLAVVVPGRLAVGGGWSGGLAVLRNMGSGWQLAATLGTRDAAAGAGGAGAGAGASGGGGGGGGSAVARQIAAMNLNAVNMVAPGGGAASTAGGLATAGAGGGEQPGHGGALVTGLHVRPVAAGGAALGGGPRWHVASSGLDGQVLLWDLSAFM
ncbi:hypothetical protein CHLRE_16g648100v5 [Chlamydomonas reinhardtii]|uniref:Arp2/3 complex 41 kDa subunit n=1 Tax=Chlamydomonas reinhardtii TaxID=3055 RepID=A0A2K3CSQ7_CHLRE|nr:uncharacterized protein CHLRE_16g648100v5 [Chlamydomonas reinhardtii]PNW71291.1 hypothetical protein CHLRE_16g648100v5 [Chlamydomonas reinhardtii]